MKILLVEDEQHKRDELSLFLLEAGLGEISLDSAESVGDAIMSVESNDYDLIILDMALPTFSVNEVVDEGGQDQQTGGVEILRELKALGKSANVIVVTQYTDVSLGGRHVKLREARKLLSIRYKQNILGLIGYKYKSKSNRSKLTRILRQKW